jgi:ribosomal protein S25
LNGNVPRTDRKGDDGRLEREVFKLNLQRARASREKENEARRADKNEDRLQMNAVNRAVKLNEIDAQRSRREHQRATLVANQALAAEHRKRQDYDKTTFTRGAVDEEFFQQFGVALR